MVEADLPAPELPENIGRYRIVRLLGEGAMGRVLLAHDPVLDRDVAIKHLRADLSIPDDVRRGLVTRMRHEARAAARVMHPHIVTLHDMGEDDRVGLYLVFEYVEGPTLKARIAGGRLSTAEAARAAVELGSALTTAHDAGILHRDVKPENVIMSKKGAKIADFGIAKIPDSTLTHQGGLMGTPAYSAPETFRTSTFSPESDQFSLASTLYEAVSGRRAFPGDDAVAVAQRILHEAAEPFAADIGVPEEVDRVFSRALSRKPRERFPSCEAFGRALSDALTATPTGAAAPPPAGTAGPAAGSAPIGGAAADAPHERKVSNILLGILAVLVTGALLARTALKSAEEPPRADATATASTAAQPVASPAPRPRTTAARSTQRASPTASAAPSGAPDAGASEEADDRPAPGDSAAPNDTAAPGETAPPATSGAPSATATVTPPPLSSTSPPAVVPRAP